MIEKFYIYIKQLFIYYTKIFKYREFLDRGDQDDIIKNIKEYINIFIIRSSGYLDDLMDIIKELPKRIFCEIVVFIMEKFNGFGKNCLKEMKQFCRYNSLRYFEKSKLIFTKYIIDLTKLLFDINLKKKCELELGTSNTYITDINSNIMVLCEEDIRPKKLLSSRRGFTRREEIIIDEKEEIQMVLDTYERMYPEYKGRGDEKEALILANIIKINVKILGN